jgi:hypothetical protein
MLRLGVNTLMLSEISACVVFFARGALRGALFSIVSALEKGAVHDGI